MTAAAGSVIVATLQDLRTIVAEEVGKATAFLSERLEAAGIDCAGSAGPVAMMTAAEVAAALKIAPRELRRLVREGGFPPPVKLGKRRIRWPRAVVEAASRGTP
jgi:predicted DNA-binding transcriptional regulator AlpA